MYFPRWIHGRRGQALEVNPMRATLSVTVLIIGLLLAAAPPLAAHHAFASEFDATKPVTLKGILTKMEWVNPHGWLYVDVKEPDGKVVNWAIEAGAPNALLKRGLRKHDFPAGLEVVITGYRAKNGSHTANGRTVTLADGRNFFMGSSGTGAPSDGRDKSEPVR
jgi:hypothetical protein